ncbi:hypothetical protein HPP92_020333 [Vanilla planifolia]|uniref:Protein preY, mitochondrial n=1 Tax=Vanilla planifolia TaxID=51239 RepID=A0A835UHI1_VANPL|nr:hypothetical protein HPP92_020333 [Vanilla planifolia]
MMRRSGALLKDARALSNTLLDILVCPISKKSLRYCQETQSLISEEIGVSFPDRCKLARVYTYRSLLLWRMKPNGEDDAGEERN